MSDDTEKPRKRRSLGGWKFIVAIVLILAYSASAAYGIMSDTSIRGLTAQMFNDSRYCTTNQQTSLKTLSYSVRETIWSTLSIPTFTRICRPVNHGIESSPLAKLDLKNGFFMR